MSIVCQVLLWTTVYNYLYLIADDLWLEYKELTVNSREI